MKVPTQQILVDIKETQTEVDYFEIHKKSYPQLSPGYNMKIKERKDFIQKLEGMLKKRGYTKCWKCGTWHNTVGHCFND